MPLDETPRSAPTGSRLALGLGVGWLAMSSSAVVIVLAAPLPPPTIAAGRLAITTLAWALVGLFTLRSARALFAGWDRGIALRALASGLLLGLHFVLWIASLSETSVPHAAVLVSLQPLFAGLFGVFVGDKLTSRLVIGVVIALFGTAIMTGGESEGATLFGDALAVLAAVATAAYLVVNRGVGHRVPLAGLLTVVNGIAALSVALGILAFGVPLWHPDVGLQGVFALVWLGLIPGFLGHGSMNWAARSVPVHVVSIAVLLEPVGAAALAALVLGQGVTGQEILGAMILLTGAGVTLLRPAAERAGEPD